MSHAIELLSSLCAVGIAAAVLFSLATQPQRTQSGVQLALVSAALLLWGLVGVLAARDEPPLAASLLAVTVLAYFAFLHHYLPAETSARRLLGRITPITLIVLLIMIWAGNGLPLTRQTVFILLLVHAAAAAWAIFISRYSQAAALRGAGLLVVAACASLPVFPGWTTSGAVLLAALAIGWIGWIIVREQAKRPLDQLNEELRLINRDLRQSVRENASLRAQYESLSQQFQAAGQYRSAFLENLGHRLRTPLNSITGYTELLQSGLYGDLNEKQIDRLGKIRRNSDNLLDMISNMLDLNALNAGRLTLTRTTFAMSDVIERAADTLEARRSEKALKLSRDLAPALPPVVGDEARIYQIITQMLDNAVKFTFEGEVVIRSRCIRVEDGVSEQFLLPLTGWLGDGEWMIVEVGDTGIGIPPEDQARIFDEFYQIADPRTEEYFGTGLGLTIAKRLAELHEGALWLKSAPDRGSTIYLALPLHRRQAAHTAIYRFTRVGWKRLAQ